MRLLQEPQRVEVFDLGLGAQLRLARAAHRYVRVAAQIAFLHVAVAHADVLQRAAQEVDVVVGLPARTEIRLADDLEQRRAGAVEVDIRLARDRRRSCTDLPASSSMCARVISNRLETPFIGPPALVALAGQDFDRAVLRKGAVVLRDLIALRQVRDKNNFSARRSIRC